jgi:hypothetical protein
MGDFDSDVHQVGAGRKEAHVDDFTSKLKIGCARVVVWLSIVKVGIFRSKFQSVAKKK